MKVLLDTSVGITNYLSSYIGRLVSKWFMAFWWTRGGADLWPSRCHLWSVHKPLTFDIPCLGYRLTFDLSINQMDRWLLTRWPFAFHLWNID